MKYHKHLWQKMVAVLDIGGILLTGSLFLTNSIVFACLENIYLEVNTLHLW